MASPKSSETRFEFETDLVLGIAFLATTVIAAKRMVWSQSQGGAETTVVTAFYSLILLTSALRAIWFLIPKAYIEPSYTPSATMAFQTPGWAGVFLSEILVMTGSVCLFSIFILILVYWADILKKYFYPGARRTKPMTIFLALVISLVAVEIINAILFLIQVYSGEGMLLVNALLLATVSIVCVSQITIFSNKFRTVLLTLGAINQVSTESQVKRITWITVTGNLFFSTRAAIEIILSLALIIYWWHYGNVDKVLSHTTWDVYIWVKHLSEVAILWLMLFILQSRFASSTSSATRTEYQQVPDTEWDEEKEAENSMADVKSQVVE